MLSFKQYLNEEKINYNHHTQHWQVRGDDSNHTFKDEREKVILKNPRSYVDHDAHEQGKKVYAYMHGEVVKHEPDLSRHRPHPVKFVRGDTQHPFVHAKTNKPLKSPEYVVFHKNTVTAYHKK